MLYIYDFYYILVELWVQLLIFEGLYLVRNIKYDCIFIVLMVEMNYRKYIDIGGFDGIYIYFVIDKFIYGLIWRFWF